MLKRFLSYQEFDFDHNKRTLNNIKMNFKNSIQGYLTVEHARYAYV